MEGSGLGACSTTLAGQTRLAEDVGAAGLRSEVQRLDFGECLVDSESVGTASSIYVLVFDRASGQVELKRTARE